MEQLQPHQPSRQEPVWHHPERTAEKKDRSHELLQKLAGFKRQHNELRAEWQELCDNEWGHFPDIEERYAKQGTTAEARKEEIERLLKEDERLHELKLIEEIEEAGFETWRDERSDIHFFAQAPARPEELSEKDLLSICRSWKAASLEIRATIDMLEAKRVSAEKELKTFRMESEGLGRGVAPDDLAEPTHWKTEMQSTIEESLRQQERLQELLDKLQDHTLDLLPHAKRYGYIPHSKDLLADLVRQETVQ